MKLRVLGEPNSILIPGFTIFGAIESKRSKIVKHTHTWTYKQTTHKTAVPRISLISITTLKATTSRIDSIVICAEFCTNQRDISNTTYYILPVIAIFGLIRLHLVCAFITVLFFFSSLFIFIVISAFDCIYDYFGLRLYTN